MCVSHATPGGDGWPRAYSLEEDMMAQPTPKKHHFWHFCQDVSFISEESGIDVRRLVPRLPPLGAVTRQG